MTSSLIVLLLFATVSLPPRRVTLRGSARDCFANQPVRTPGVHTYAFDVRKNRKMLATLRRMDRMDWSDRESDRTMKRFLSKYDSVMAMVHRSHAMATSTSDSDGDFALIFPAVDTVVVFGYDEVEDEPVFYSYKVLNGRRDRSFILDMSRGGCNRHGK